MKNKFLVLCLVICVVFSMQAISAESVDADVLNQTDHISADDVDGDVLQASDEGQDVLAIDDEIPWEGHAINVWEGGNFSKLNQTIQNAENNSVIVLWGDFEFDESTDNVGAIHITGKSLIIDAQGHTIDAKNKTRIFWFENGNFTVFKNIVFKNALNLDASDSFSGGAVSLVGNGRFVNCTFINNSAGRAGAIYWGYANKSQIFNCTFEGNRALSYGGGAIRIRNNMTNVVIENSTFINNHAPSDGGAIHFANTQGSNSNNIFNCTFINNTAVSGGGAVLVQAPGCSVINSTFINNSATYGGSIRWDGYSGTIRNTTFTTNHASSQGGAIHGSGDQPIVILCHFDNNTAPEAGAIWWNQTENGVITNSTFNYNIATGNAGAVHIAGTLCNITYSNFTHNSADNGASIFLDVGAYISECLFEHEHASTDGGAIYLNSVNINPSQISQSVLSMLGLFNSTIFNCTAGNDGGAGYIRASGGSVANVTFINCSAGHDGGAGYVYGSNGRLYNSTFIGNNATSGNGGAVYWYGINGTAYDVKIYNNTALNGGGIYLSKPADVSITDGYSIVNQSDFSNNAAIDNGGSIYCGGMFTNILYSNFTYDKATNGSGVYLNVGAYIYECSFFKENATYDGGGIYLRASNTGDIPQAFIDALGDRIGVVSTNITNCTAGHDGGAGYVVGNGGIVHHTNMINCSAGHDGGAGYVSGNSGKLYNSTMLNNVAGNDGGALFWEGNGGHVDNVTCNNNFADDDGGSIYILGSNISINKSNFTLTNATNYGGSIYIAGNYVNITESLFERCAANNYHGGAVYITGMNITIKKSNFTMNRVDVTSARGGSIDVQGDNTTIDECIFDRCSAYEGGVVYVNGTGIRIQNTSCNRSLATNGGAFYVNGNNATIYNVSVSNNNATSYGGAVYVAGNFANITNSSFMRCIADDFHGGAIYIRGLNTTISKSHFQMNRATNATNNGRGGSIDVQGDGTNIFDCTFIQCSGYEGGVLYVNGTGIVIDNCTSNMSSAVNGGAVYVMGNNVTVSEFKVSRANATDYGGGIYVAGDFLNVTDSNFTMCVASNFYGGAIYIVGLNTTISRSNFTQNNATNTDNVGRGGSIGIQGNGTNISDCIFSRSSALEGGALYINGTGVTITNCTSNMTSAINGGSVYIMGNNVTFNEFRASMANATDYGGGVYIAGNFANITNSNFSSCMAFNFHGGAIYIRGLNATVSWSNFTMNNATNYPNSGRGGSIDVMGNGTNISDCIFSKCNAYEGGVLYVNGTGISITNCTSSMSNAFNGGAVYIMGDDVAVDKFKISQATATISGGAIYVAGDYNNITNSNFNTNVAQSSNGGSIYIEGVNVTIAHSTFNTTVAASASGGSIYIEGDNATMNNVTCENAIATDGAAIYVAGDSCELYNSTFNSNKAFDDSAVYWQGDNGTIYNITCFNNTGLSAQGHHSKGGSLSIIGNGTSVDKSNFTQSHAGNQAGAVYVTGNDVNVTNSVFYNCTINDENGGAMYILGNRTHVINCSFELSNATNGGAIYVLGDNITVAGTNITNTNASTSGGAIYIEGLFANITECNFNLTNAFGHTDDGGGAIFVMGNYTSISKSNFTDTRANYNNRAIGGAIYIQGDGVNVTDSNFNNTGANLYGGAIYIAGVNTTVKGSNFTNCSVNNGYGGAIYIVGANTTVNKSEFKNCFSQVDGGAIYCHGENGQILYSNFDDNIAYSGGGALYWAGGQAQDSIIGCTFNHNLANFSGGAVYWGYGGTGGLIQHSNFTNNIANAFRETSTGSGGAIYWDRNIEGRIDNCSFINNSALLLLGASGNDVTGGQAGALFWDGVNGTIENSYFANNTAHNTHNTHSGGAIQWDAQGGLINNVTFEYNQALHGGAIAGTRSTDLVINGSTFKYNNATAGGAVWLESSERVNITNTIFETNNAEYGGALYFNQNAVEPYFENCTFDNNSAYQAGAIYFKSDANININSTINGSYFYNNHVIEGNINDKHAGAIYYAGRYHVLINSVFENNTAIKWAGAIYWVGEYGQINNTTFKNNNATNDGGAILWSGAHGNIYNCTFESNNALTYNGGAIFWYSGIANPDLGRVINSTFINNYAKQDGGALYWGYQNGYAENLTFINNTVSRYGGALYWASQNGTLINASFDNNNASQAGGTIYWAGSEGKMYHVNITNSVGKNGGSIYWSGSQADVYNLTINTTRSTGGNGGAITTTSHNSVWTNVTVINSRSNNNGGSINIEAANIKVTLNNITINNSNSTQNGAAIYSKEASVTMNNLTISNTRIISNNNDGGAIAITGTDSNRQVIVINNANITNSFATLYGGAIYGNYLKELNLTNVCINESSVDGDGGAIYLENTVVNVTANNVNITNSLARGNGGAIYLKSTSNNFTNLTIFTVTAQNGAGIYVISSSNIFNNASISNATASVNGGGIYVTASNNAFNKLNITNSTAVLGGAIYMGSVENINITNSSITNNNASSKAGAIYLNNVLSTNVFNTNITNNNATQGSAIYAESSTYNLENVTLLDNQAHSHEFINKEIGTYANGTHYLSATFVGYDNLLNSIWSDDESTQQFTNVTYWDADGVTTTNTVPDKSDYEAGQNITVEKYDSRLRAPSISTATVVTDGDGKFTYNFEGDGVPIASFDIYHLEDTYYTYLKDSISINTTIVNVTVEDITHYQNATVIVNLTDGDGNKLSGSVTVTINATELITITVDVVDGVGSKNVSGLAVGTYNASAIFIGNTTHLGSTNLDVFNVIPLVDLNITKRVNTTVAYIGDSIQYEINVTNHGPDTALDVKVNETLSPDLELTNEVSGYDKDTGIWTIGELAKDATATLTLIVKVINNGTIANSVNVTSWGNDTNTSNDNASAENVTALPVNNFTIIKTNNLTNNICSAGELVNFTITVTNNGPSNATNVNITDELDSVFEFDSASEGGIEENGVVRWVIGSMNNGTTLEFWVVVKVKTNGTYTNVATINSTENNTGRSNSTQITVTPVNNLTLVKSNNWTDNVGYVGELVNFTITVTNNGPSNASDVNIVDELNSAFEVDSISLEGTHDVTNHKITWNIDYLVNGTSHEVWVVVKVKSNGTFENRASVTSTENNTQKTNGTDITVKPVNNFTVVKYANITGDIWVNDLVNFTINVTNNGPSNATNINITDVLAPEFEINVTSVGSSWNPTTRTVSWNIASLNNGTTESVWVVVRVLTNGTFRNNATVNSTENITGTTNGTDITVKPVNNFTVVKYANITGDIWVNDLVNFTINVTNNGPSNATNVNITDVLGPEFNYEAISDGGSWNAPTRTVSWNIASLNNGTTESVWVVVRVITNGTFRNNATVNSTENTTGTTNGTDITVKPVTNLTVVKTSNWTGDVGYAGSLVNFTITVTNNGPSNATNVNITDELDLGFEYIDSNCNPSADNRTVVWEVGDLNNGASYEAWVVVKVLNNGTFRNNVTVNSTENSTGTTNGTDITAEPVNNFTVVKYANITGDIWVNDLVNFTINVTNNGPSNATNVNITDVLGSEFEFNATSERGYYNSTTRTVSWAIGNLDNGTTESVWVVVRVLTNGTFRNVATVNSTENTTGTTNGTDITVKPVNNLTIIKYANVTGHVNVGDLVNFTINVTNHGPSVATNVNITDMLPVGLELIGHGGNVTGDNSTVGNQYIVNWNYSVLNSNDMLSFWVVVRVTTNDTFTNTARVNSTENTTGASNETTITSDPVTNLTVIKYANVTGSVMVNSLVNFTINVTNHGPSNATNVNITDNLPMGMIVDSFGGNATSVKSTDDAGQDTVVWKIDHLNKDEMLSLWVVVRINTNGTFRNVATANSTENTTGTTNGTDITVNPVNNFTIIKYANITGDIWVNDLVNFTINVTNNGPSNATNVNVTDVLGPEFEFDHASVNSSYNPETRTVSWNISSLNNGTNTSVWVVVKVLTNGTFRNVATVNSTENITGTTNGTVITVKPVVNLTVVKASNWTDDIGYVGQLVNFTITITNNGPSNATNVNITDDLDLGFEYIDSNGNPSADNRTVSWNILSLNNGTSHEAWIVVKVLTNGTLRNNVTVNSTENTTGTTNGTDIAVNPFVNLTVVKTSNWTGDVGYAGQLVNFTITVTNNGPSNATNVNITDDLDLGFEYIDSNGNPSADNRAVVWEIGNLNNGTSYDAWIVVKVLNNGTLRNNVTVNSTENTTGTTNGTDINVIPVNNFTIIKHANVTEYAFVNDYVNFTINVTNNGPSNATNVIVNDTLPVGLAFVSAGGNVSGSNKTIDGIEVVTWSIPQFNNGEMYSLWVIVKVSTNGTFTNIASVNSTENTTGTSNEINLVVKPVTNLTIVKSSNWTDNIGYVDQLVNFTITVTNNGPSNATNVNVTDVLGSEFELEDKSDNAEYDSTTRTLSWNIGDMANNTSRVVWVVVKVKTNGTLTNLASVNSTENGTGKSNSSTIDAKPVNNLTIIKYSNVTGYAFVNDYINFTINVTNHGPSNATNVVVNDTLPAGLIFVSAGGNVSGSNDTVDGKEIVTWSIPELNNGEMYSLWVIVKANTNGTFTNWASVNSTENTTGSSNYTSLTVKPFNNLTLIKYAEVIDNIKVGDLVNFTINVTNYGPSNATNVVVNDTLPAGLAFVSAGGNVSGINDTVDGIEFVTWSIPELNNGEMLSLWVLVEFKTDGSFTNWASVNSTENTTGTSNSSTVSSYPVTKLTIIKSSNLTDNIGYVNDLVNFTITVTNDGPSNATNVNVSDVLSSDFELKDYSAGGNYNPSTRTISWNLEDMENNTSRVVWVTVKVNTNNTFTNTAFVNSTENGTGQYGSVDITIKPVTNLTLIKYSNVTGNAFVNDLVNFTINVTNNGPSNATNVVVNDTLPVGLAFVSAGGNVSGSNDTVDGHDVVTWSIPSLNNGEMYSLWVVVKVLTNGTFVNVASVNSTENTTGGSNESELVVKPVTNLTIVKSSNLTNNVGYAGQLVNFTITVTNNGPSNATNVNVSDVLHSDFLFNDSDGEYNRTTHSVTWNLHDMANNTSRVVWVVVRINTNGTFTNLASVNSTENTTGNSNSTQIEIKPFNNLTIIKYSNVTGYAFVNDLVNFTINVTNYGPSNATNVVVNDTLPVGLLFVSAGGNVSGSNSTVDGHDVVTWSIPSLNNGEMYSLWVVVKVLSNGTFVNVASVNSTENTTGGSNESELIVKPVTNLTIVKSSNWTEAGYVGQLVNFTITVTNNGPSNATNVNVSDVLDSDFLFNDSDGEYNGTTHTVTWNIGDMANNTSRTVWVVVKVNANGTFTNVASVNSTENSTGNNNKTEIAVKPVTNLTIVKSSNLTGGIGYVGQLVNFTIVVTNYGPSNATNVNVSDVLDSDFLFNDSDGEYNGTTHTVTWNIGDMANNTSHTVWVVVKVTTNGTFTNLASVNSTENTTSHTNETQITIYPFNNLTIIKQANITTNIQVGDLVNFTINVTNYGPSNASNVNITDTLPHGLEFVSAGGNVSGSNSTVNGHEVVKWNISSLNNGEMLSLWVIVKVNTTGTFTNTVHVNTTENTTGASNETQISSIPITNLGIVKSSNLTNSNCNVEDSVKFTIRVTNYGPSDATNVNVRDALNSNFEFINSNGVYNRNAHTVTWSIGNLAYGASREVWVEVKVKSNGTFTNVASVTSAENPTGASGSTVITVSPVTNLTIIKQSNVTGSASVNDLVNFTINVTNYGPSNASNVNVSDVLDYNFEFIDSDGVYNSNSHGVFWNVGDLNNNSSCVVWVVVKVKTNGTFTNVASVNSTENSTGSSNETNITVNPVVNLTIVKQSNVSGSASVNDLVNFTITVTNYGPSNATNVNVSDILDSNFAFIDSDGVYNSNTHSVFWNIGDMNNGTSHDVWVVVRVLTNGTFTNLASVNSTENSTVTANGTNITVCPVVNLTIIKQSNITGNAYVNDLVNFTISVTNNGPSNATNVNVSDVLDSNFVFIDSDGVYNSNTHSVFWNIGNMNNNSSRDVWVVVKVKTNGTFTNIASVNSSENSTGTTNGTNITVNSVTNLSIIKQSNVSGNASVNDLVNFTITVTNNGPSNATNVNVSDVLDSNFVFIDSDGVYNSNTHSVFWNIGNMNNNSSRDVWVVVKVKTNGTFTNVATVNSTENSTGTTNGTNITVNPVTNLTIIKISNVTVGSVTDLVNYTIEVTNNGPSNATNVNVTDILPGGLAYVESGSDSRGISEVKSIIDGNEVIVWNIGNLNNGESIKVWVVVRILSEGTFVNVASVNSSENSTGSSNGTNISAISNVDLEITKTVDVQTVSYGDVITYTIKVKNNGPCNATGVNVTEILSSHVKLVEASVSQGKYDSYRNIWQVGNLNNKDVANLTLKVVATYTGNVENTVIITQNENDTNMSNNNYTCDNVTVIPANSSVWAPDIVEYYGNAVTVTVSTSNASSVTYNIIDSDGQIISNGTLAVGQNITDILLDVGEYSVNLTTITDENHYPASYQSKITILKADSPIEVKTNNITYGENENITIILPEGVNGTVNITVANRTYDNIPVINGTVNLVVPDLPGGNHTVDVVYSGDKNHNGNSTSASFEVARAVPVIEIEVVDIWYGEIEVLNVTVNAPGSVNVTVNGITVTIELENGVITTNVLAASGTPNYDGKATWNLIGLNAGVYPAFAIYNGNENYTSVNTTDQFTVRALPTTVTVKADDIKVGDDAIINVEVGPANATGNVTITVEGKKYTQELENGKATFTVSGLKAGTKTVSVSYPGDGNYLASQNSTTFKVNKIKPSVDVTSHDIEEGQDEVIVIHLPEDATGKVTIIVDGKKYTAPVKDGKAVFNIPDLKPGNYEIKVHYSGDDKYLPADTTDSFKVSSKDKPHNNTHSHSGIDLTVHQTGNPILYILLILIAIILMQIRKIRK